MLCQRLDAPLTRCDVKVREHNMTAEPMYILSSLEALQQLKVDNTSFMSRVHAQVWGVGCCK